jgi:hypothetical protein
MQQGQGVNAAPDFEADLAVELATMNRMTRALPQAGGLFDQDAYVYKLLQAGLEALAEKERREHEKAKITSKKGK